MSSCTYSIKLFALLGPCKVELYLNWHARDCYNKPVPRATSLSPACQWDRNMCPLIPPLFAVNPEKDAGKKTPGQDALRQWVPVCCVERPEAGNSSWNKETGGDVLGRPPQWFYINMYWRLAVVLATGPRGEPRPCYSAEEAGSRSFGNGGLISSDSQRNELDQVSFICCHDQRGFSEKVTIVKVVSKKLPANTTQGKRRTLHLWKVWERLKYVLSLCQQN